MDSLQDSPAPPGAQAVVRKKRGRESAGDMLRSLGVVLVLVVLMWFLAQPPDSDEQRVRVVDPTTDVASSPVASGTNSCAGAVLASYSAYSPSGVT